MRIGIMGLGRIGAFHAATLAGLDAVDSLVVTDPVAAAAASAERFGASAVDSPEAVFAAGVDGVVIAAATDAHSELILAAVKAGVPVFCEKPVAKGVEESLEVLRAVEGSGVEVHIGYNRRFDAGCVAARKAVVSGELGALHTVRSTFGTLRELGFDGVATACVFAWEERARESAVFMLDRITKELGV